MIGRSAEIERPPLPPGARRKLIARDGERCCDCGATDVALEIEHNIPWWKVKKLLGRNRDWFASLANLRLRCLKCHKAKTAREAPERAHQLRLERRRHRAKEPLVGADGQRLT